MLQSYYIGVHYLASSTSHIKRSDELNVVCFHVGQERTRWEPPCPHLLLLQSGQRPWWPPLRRAAPCTKKRSLSKVPLWDGWGCHYIMLCHIIPFLIMDVSTYCNWFVFICLLSVSPPSECPMHQAQPVKGISFKINAMQAYLIIYDTS